MIAVVAALLCSCQEEPRVLDEGARELLRGMAHPTVTPDSLSNRFADDALAAEFGRALFSDPGLSAGGTFSCASCHQPERRFTDGERVHTMLGTGKRNVPTIESAGWQTWFFWDGRTDSAWAQATHPIRDPLEMGNSAARVRAHTAADLKAPYEAIFGPIDAQSDDLVLANVGKALEAFERAIPVRETNFDRFVSNNFSGNALSDQQQRGLAVFVAEGCTNCHNGPMFTDGQFHNIGVPPIDANDLDPGRGEGAEVVLTDPYNCRGAFSDSSTCDELRFLDPEFADGPGSFKTPTLRGVAETAPYFHNGSVNRLDEVVELYERLPGAPLLGHRDLLLKPLELSGRDHEALVAFLSVL